MYHTDGTGNTDMGGQPSREEGAADGKVGQQQPGEEVDDVVLGHDAAGPPQEATGGGRKVDQPIFNVTSHVLSHTAIGTVRFSCVNRSERRNRRHRKKGPPTPPKQWSCPSSTLSRGYSVRVVSGALIVF